MFYIARYRMKHKNSNTTVDATPLSFMVAMFFNFDEPRIVVPAILVQFRQDTEYEFTLIQGRSPPESALVLICVKKTVFLATR